MATIKAIEARSVHQIQSGQVIVDLCSVAKELIENSLDAGATSIEVRFRNNGLDLIEVQDNGSGISPENYENVALKHYTSKLSSFDDLARLQTFGFRGEALSSLCALADFHIVTAQANQAPRATRLEFEQSGKLKKTQMIAGPRGTTASVEGIFKKLPVRRRELEKNIKREYGKVLNLLHAYACVSTGVRFSVKNTVGKTRNVVVFTTNGNQTTKENIANVYGAKTLLALIPLDLELEFAPSVPGRRVAGDGDTNKIVVRGHVSRPVFGEGRQTPDRQMFFVNSRPCALPQIAKAFNEVYKSFNVAQSPFVFADFHMDTNAYDVNVSPDKRTILLHDAGALIDSLKQSLTQLFESSDQTVPQSQVLGSRVPLFKQKSGSSQVDAITKSTTAATSETADIEEDEASTDNEEVAGSTQLSSQDRMKSLLSDISARGSRADTTSSPIRPGISSSQEPSSPFPSKPQTKGRLPREDTQPAAATENEVTGDGSPFGEDPLDRGTDQHGVEEHPEGDAPSGKRSPEPDSSQETPNAIQNAFDRMRPRRVPAELATITIGNKTITSMVGSGVPRKRDVGAVDSGSSPAPRKRRIHTPSRSNIFGKHMRDFAAPGSQIDLEAEEGEDEEEESEDGQGVEEEEVVEREEEEEIENESEDGSYAPSDNDAASRGSVDNDIEGSQSCRSPSPVDEDIDDEKKKLREDAEVERLIREAEEKAALPQANTLNRANKFNKGAGHRDSTAQLTTTIDCSLSRIQLQAQKLQENLGRPHVDPTSSQDEADASSIFQAAAEERLSLTVAKDDFARMRIIGQFNLGFILATRSSKDDMGSGASRAKDELFIIDQHASDEKFNFERLQAETIVQNQRLVQPQRLDLTAVEEEIVIENQAALEKNGFIVDVDDSGDEPIGRRCRLLSLPLSKEVVFNVRDLEELIVLLSETASSTMKRDTDIPRPSKVRKMFAMRACRSSIMIGKNLTQKQMEKVVRNMGTIDKPWNCPHGRPTMRHLLSLGQWDDWNEYEELDEGIDRLDSWKEYLDEASSQLHDDSE